MPNSVQKHDRARVLLVEDHPVVRLGLKTIIRAQLDMELVGEAESAEQALAEQIQKEPDLVILPLRLEGKLEGVELCREIKSLDNAPLVLIYTSYNAREDASATFLSGADGFVHKGEETGRLLETIRALLSGHRVWLLGTESPGTARLVKTAVERSGLTRREHEILGLMLQHLTNAQIGNELFIELPTVKSHVRSILAKLGLHSRRELF